MKQMLGLFLGIAVIVVLMAGPVLAQEAVIKTVIDNGNCPLIADGRTEYRLDVWLDNTGLGEATDGVRWRVKSPEGLEFNVIRVNCTQERRPENDFFADKIMFFEYVRPRFWQLHARLVDLGQGVYQGEGNLVNYWFTISPMNQSYVRTNFTLGLVEILSPGGNPQPFRVENQEFIVVRDGFPVMSAKCRR